MVGSGRFETLPQKEFGIPLGDVLTLKSWNFPSTAKPSQTIPITLGWQTTSIPICCSYSIGIYAFAPSGQLVAQVDNPPKNGHLLTSSLPTNYLLEDTKSLEMPKQDGIYTLYVGVYNNATMDRLTVPGSTDNLVKIGEVQVNDSG